MAKGMREIKRSIKSTQNTKQITRAMEMVASSKLRRAQEAAVASRPYSDKMKEVVASIASGGRKREASDAESRRDQAYGLSGHHFRPRIGWRLQREHAA